ncbi:MAG: hypothetical protein ACLR8U_08165 [Oscillospiraceae bacterium]
MTNTCDQPPEGDLNRLFDRFYRPDASRTAATGDFGIGLSIAKSIAESPPRPDSCQHAGHCHFLYS